jgi:hypothetical protein
MPKPVVTSISPASGSTAGGDIVTITGTGFAGAENVSFGPTRATAMTFKDDTQVTATSPPGNGTVDIRVTTGAGISDVGQADQFTYTYTRNWRKVWRWASGAIAAALFVRRPLPKHWAAIVLVVAVASSVAGIWVYAAHQPPGIDVVRLQWAASLADKDLGGIRQHAAQFRGALDWDMRALIPGYGVGLLLACYLGWRVFWTSRSQAWAVLGMAAAALAVACNIAQDLLLLRALSDGLGRGALLDWIEALSFAKFAVLLVAGAVGIAAIMVTIGRLAMSSRTKERWGKAAKACGPGEWPVIPPPVIEHPAQEGGGAASWRLAGQEWWDGISTGPRARWAQGFASPSTRTEDAIGVCVSGGGIRSATVALGALDALREKDVLKDAEYLVSVSGGGYTAGGLQLAMTRATDGLTDGQPPVSRATAADGFAPGSPEEDYLRRHSSYIADSLSQWLVALGVLLRGVLSSLVIIGLTITTLGLAIGAFYRRVPITAGGNLPPPKFAVTGTNVSAPAYPAVPVGVWYAIAVAAGLTVLAYLARQLAAGRERWRRRTSRSAVILLSATLLLAGLGVALPALLWASSWVTWKLDFSLRPAAALGSLTVVTTYLGAVVATFWRNRTTIAKTAGTITGAAGKGPVNQVLPNSMIQLILMWICLAFLILVALLFCSWAATSALVHSLWALAPAGVLAVLAVIIDQTSLSLHPFYRRRLARAFAVRRVSRDHVDAAVPYRDDEGTWLDTYAEPAPGFPAVTFAATANITGQDRTPPGRAAVPFMLTHDYIGGPATGWVHTGFLRNLLPRALRADLTTEAAMAISGAAFASAMGSQTRFYEVFLAIANARLGAWLPNPRFVALKLQRDNLDNWTIPGLPARRGLSYFAREIFGIHPSTGRLLLCTDGGHYDNLGLTELLRRRCKLIYCIDASGASQPFADALAGAITLAREELGVEITLDNQGLDLVAGDRQQLEPASSFTSLNAHLSKSPVVTGKITYPEVAHRCEPQGCAPPRGKEDSNYPQATGQLVFAQAVLTPDLPYQLLDYLQSNPGFPHDSTGDQFFNAAQFDAYQTLGYFLGQKAADSSDRKPVTPSVKHTLAPPPTRSHPRRQLRLILIPLRRAQR